MGVFICHCGVNIAGTVDVQSVAEKVGKIEDVAHSTDYIYMCSEPGQQIIREAIREKGLDGVVVACCSPSMHENTFRKAVKSQGMNPYLCEIANIREQCSWVHQKEKEEATQKAEEIIKATLQKVRKNEMLEAIAVDINRRVLVVGGGIAGITASLDLAEGGYEVFLLEREAASGWSHGPVVKDLSRSRSCFRWSPLKGIGGGEASQYPSSLLFRIRRCEGLCGEFRIGYSEKDNFCGWEEVHRMWHLY